MEGDAGGRVSPRNALGMLVDLLKDFAAVAAYLWVLCMVLAAVGGAVMGLIALGHWLGIVTCIFGGCIITLAACWVVFRARW